MTLGQQLSGKHILIVEDEPLIALDLAYLIEEAGAVVIGPAHSLSEAQELAAELGTAGRIDGALMDIDLGDSLIWPLATVLHERGIPLAFISARCRRDDRPTVLDTCTCIDKPAAREHILRVAGGF
jgi:DNA-binding response OmpR family regulator